MKKTGSSVKLSKSREAGMRDLTRAMAGAKDAAELREFMEGILTPQERARIALRWELTKMLCRGVPQRKIGSTLGISLCKITRGSMELKRGPAGFAKTVERAMSRK